MTRETLTTRHDARLANVALSLAQGYIDAEFNPHREGGIEAQREAFRGNYKNAFEAVAGQMEHGGEDVRGLFRLARKVRAIGTTR